MNVYKLKCEIDGANVEVVVAAGFAYAALIRFIEDGKNSAPYSVMRAFYESLGSIHVTEIDGRVFRAMPSYDYRNIEPCITWYLFNNGMMDTIDGGRILT